MSCRGVIFDLDGTLADTLEDLADGVNTALAEEGLPVHPVEDYRYFVGNGVKMLVRRAMPHERQSDEALFERLLARNLEIYGEHYLDKTRAYRGMPETVHSLAQSGVRLAVVTNKPDYRAREIVQTLYGDCFSMICGNTPGYPTKPDPALTRHVMAALDLCPEETVFVGDSAVDIQTAQNAGLRSVGVLWGFREREELQQAGADFLANTPAALEKIIQKL